MASSINDEIATDVLKGDLALQMSVAETNQAVQAVLDDLQVDLERQLLNSPELSAAAKVNASQLKTAAAKSIADHIAQAETITNQDLAGFAQEASLQFIDSVQEHLDDFNPTQLNANDLRSIAAGNAINGTPTTDWWRGQKTTTITNYTRKINSAILQGQTNAQMVRLIRGTKAAAFADGIMKLTRAQVETLVRTSVANVANKSRQMTFEQNSDLIKGVRHLSTLDGRTSDICKARSGATYKLENGSYTPVGHSFPFAGGPPYHPRCRSTMVPITKSWAELNKSPDPSVKAKLKAWKPNKSTQASMDGQVPENMTWAQFADRKGSDFLADVLGPGRATLVANGSITITDLINKQGQIRSLATLQGLTKASKLIEPEDIRSISTAAVKAIGGSAPLITLGNAPAKAPVFNPWKQLPAGKGGTRGGIRWDQSARSAKLGDQVVEMDVEHLRSEHQFSGLKQVKLDELKEVKGMNMATVDLTEDGLLTIIDGQHEVIAASARGIERILVSVPDTSAILAKIAQKKALTKKLAGNKRLSEHPLGREDIVSFFWNQPIQNKGAFRSEFGRINHKKRVGDQLSDKEQSLTALFDDVPERKDLGNFTGVFKDDKFAMGPDVAAQMAFEEGFITAPDVSLLYRKIAQDIHERRTLTKKIVSAADDAIDEEGALLDAAQKRFEKLTGTGSKAKGDIYVDNRLLTKGDVIQADDELFRVIDDDGHGGLILQDGPKYGEVFLEPGKKIRSQVWLTEDTGVSAIPKDVLKAEGLEAIESQATAELEALRAELAELVNIQSQGVALTPSFQKLAKTMADDVARLESELAGLGQTRAPVQVMKPTFTEHDRADGFLYHVTTKKNADSILTDRKLKVNQPGQFSEAENIANSKGRVFLAEKNEVWTWQLEIAAANPTDELAVLKIAKKDLDGHKIKPDPGSSGANVIIENDVLLSTAKQVKAKVGKAGAVHSDSTLSALAEINALRNTPTGQLTLERVQQLKDSLAKNYTAKDLRAIVVDGTQFGAPTSKADAITKLTRSMEKIIGDQARESFGAPVAGAGSQPLGAIVLRTPTAKTKGVTKVAKPKPKPKVGPKKAAAAKPITDAAATALAEFEQLVTEARGLPLSTIDDRFETIMRGLKKADIDAILASRGLSKSETKGKGLATLLRTPRTLAADRARESFQ